MEGTYNRKFSTITKDFIKSLLFAIDTQKKSKRDELNLAQTVEDKFRLCNQLLGVHQSKFEIASLINYLNENLQPEIICEIGTANSGTNLLLSKCLTNAKLLIGLDLYVKNTPKLNYYAKPIVTKQLNGDSKALSTLTQLKLILGGKKIDFLFIDGDHSYEGVKADFEAYLPLMSEKSVIAFHDIVPDFKTRYGKDTGMWVGEVPKYWVELKQRYARHLEIIENSAQDGQGIGMIMLNSKE